MGMIHENFNSWFDPKTCTSVLDCRINDIFIMIKSHVIDKYFTDLWEWLMKFYITFDRRTSLCIDHSFLSCFFFFFRTRLLRWMIVTDLRSDF